MNKLFSKLFVSNLGRSHGAFIYNSFSCFLFLKRVEHIVYMITLKPQVHIFIQKQNYYSLSRD